MSFCEGYGLLLKGQVRGMCWVLSDKSRATHVVWYRVQNGHGSCRKLCSDLSRAYMVDISGLPCED